MRAFWIIPTLALASTGWATAQDVPPPPPMRGEAASLEDTMKFLQDKLPGKVNYMVYIHDNATGVDKSGKRSFELSNVAADAGHCSVSFHERFVNGTNHVVDGDGALSLKQVREIALMQMDQSIQRATAKDGHPELDIRTDPPVFLVVVRSEPNHSITFDFYDEALSDRVSKALQHAVDLCGGGNQEPF
jgi:hypothetical protein